MSQLRKKSDTLLGPRGPSACGLRTDEYEPLGSENEPLSHFPKVSTSSGVV